MGTSEGAELLVRHVERFNHGVRSGDFSRMLEGFAEDAEMIFEGADAGPYLGRAAVARAYAADPPDDEIEIVETFRRADGTIVASYRWKSQPSIVAGEMRMTFDGSKITRLVVTFGTHSPEVTPS